MAGAPRAAVAIYEALATHHPGADTELEFRTAFELLIATVLSAQSTDRRVNEVTPALFARYPGPQALAGAAQDDVETLIHSTGFFRQKAKAVIGLATALVDDHGGEVPADMNALVALPGVGRKTANVVLGHALGVPGFPVDRHVLRVAARLGLIHTDDAVKAEGVLTALFPAALWTRVSDTLILHGRRICGPTPSCDLCHARQLCPHAVTGTRRARPPVTRAKAPAAASTPGRRPKAAAAQRPTARPRR
ncbi:MAG: endonuclease III [Acidobacteria bacterium]|nr:endonuclease III [Acidobacteriota bacterium]